MRGERGPATLALEDGRVFRGRAFGACAVRGGEVVFNTALSGYQEVISDPSYAGQIVVMTAPLIGNYGVTPEDMESDRLWLSGFVIRELSRVVSSFRATGRLEDLLAEHGVPGIDGVDTRALTRHIRDAGAMRSVLSTDPDLQDAGDLIARALAAPPMVGQDLVRVVSRTDTVAWTEGHVSAFSPEITAAGGERPHVVAIDYGVKTSILRNLVAAGFRVTVVPATATAEEIAALAPDGVFLSNGPGDPAALPYAHEAIRGLIGRFPLFGICLGHQILAHALGATTEKMKFGHHGGNQPVKELTTGRIEITAQNHGFAVRIDDDDPDLEVTHVNLNDHTNEGFRHRSLPIMCVQYHPEAGPGPHDALHLFGRFRRLIGEAAGRP